MTDPTDLSDAELQSFWRACRQTLDEMNERVRSSPDMQEAMREMMISDDMTQAFKFIGLSDPDASEIVVRSSLAAIYNLQVLGSIEAEQKDRAKLN